MNAATWFLGLLDAIGSGPPGARMRQCPAHRDSAPSLSVGQGENGKALVQCHAGCNWQAILAALTLPTRYLFTPPPVPPAAYAKAFVPPIAFPPVDLRGGGHPTARGMRFEAEHAYGDRWWLLRYRHPVTGVKEISWECLNPHGDRVPGLLGTPTSALPLYRERDVRLGVAAGETVLVVESESSVDALRGWYATTWAGGAGSPNVARLQQLLVDHADVVLVPDHDAPGLACADRIRAVLPAARTLLGHPGEDARDLYARLGPDEFRAAIEGATP